MENAPHLTRIILNTRSKEVRRDLSNVHDLHRTVMSPFKDTSSDTPRAELGVLYRLDSTNSGATLLIQSTDAPKIEALPEGYGAITTVSMKNLLMRLQNEATVRYRIAANFVTNSKQADGKHKKIALGHQPAIEKWTRLATENGLQLASEPQAMAATITGKSNKNNITLRPWIIEGVATITNQDDLIEVMTSGLGRGKAYGCGLLSISIL